ncbi:hypothetical protein [Cellulomonas soli]|uniref:Uncharacterized protein n=1 Tax=Cellulomonas soli TaxID=931535 RepID=A0A512PAH5_9CELL|nr:hypothetical protein [Cellulomonas soli]NYI60683.1 hypothetical protein [Cellulomonas soli]GEP68198.1 hypothetical protein CSO01_09130 [Cellulomonas soli]
MDHPHDLTSDPAVEHIAEPPIPDAALAAQDARSGGDAQRAPRSLLEVELEPDDEDIASGEEWDAPETL